MTSTENAGGPNTILLVDDNEMVRKIARLFLETQTDMQVCGEAVDGVDAIEKAKN